jgi:WD40 repeat protein
MMRTIEIFLVIIIITAAFIISSFYAVLPQPRQVSPLNLRRLALTTLQTLDVNYDLSGTAFKSPSDLAWGQLQIALSACLPPSIVYNLTVYEVLSGGTQLYTPIHSISNAKSLGVSSDASSYLVASSNVTFSVIPEKIGEHGGGGTLYILNCSDANGWWITGYTGQSLAGDLYKLLSPYFKTTIMLQNTTQLAKILDGTSIQGETLRNATVINTVGEAVPIPSGYYASSGVGYDASHSSYARYCYVLGQKVRQYNWTWVSIVGYPLYYVSNTGLFPNEQNTWGIYGMRLVGAAGLNAFLQGIDNQAYSYNTNWITGEPGVVYLSSEALYYCNYYGIYPSPYQTSTRALPDSILNTYHLTATSYIFNTVNHWIAGAVYKNRVSGLFLALGLTRTPDIRLTGLGLLCAFKPRLYRSEYTASGTSRLVVLQLGQVGGV